MLISVGLDIFIYVTEFLIFKVSKEPNMGRCWNILWRTSRLGKKYRPNAKIIMVDFNHQLCRSFIYLSKLYPNANHIMPDLLDNTVTEESISKGSFVYVPVECYKKLKELKADLYSNFFSFGKCQRMF